MNPSPGLLWAVVAVFAPLSLVTIGGGQAVVADIHRQVVEVHGWMREADFVDAFAISRMAPGPGSLLVTLIGWQIAGLWGALAATLAIFGPSVILIYGVTRMWHRSQGARWQLALEAGLRPVAAGMILASVLVLLTALEGGWLARAIAFASAALLMLTRINPLLLVAAGAAVLVVFGGAIGATSPG